MAALRWVIALVVAMAAPARAATIHGRVIDGASHAGIANAVVAFETRTFATTNAAGQFELRVPDSVASGIVWVRVPDGFTPGPVWAAWPAAHGDVELALHRLATPIHQPFSAIRN